MENEYSSEDQTYDQSGAGDSHAYSYSSNTRGSDEDRKLFVGGISWEVSQDELKEYFTRFGTVTDCTLKTDLNTGRSRGFGFVQFSDVSSVDRVLAEKPHVLKGKTIDPKRARAMGDKEPVKKIFVGGLDINMSEEEVKSYFAQYGQVETIELPFDRTKGVRRGFCFITFVSEEAADRAVQVPRQKIGARECDLKKAVSKNELGPSAGRGGRGGFRGRGGGYPGYQPGGYDYSGYYGGYGYGYDYSGYGGYDYSSYYNNPAAWGYNGSGYGAGYDYSSWQGQAATGDQAQEESSYGKAKRGAPAVGASGYHPYQR